MCILATSRQRSAMTMCAILEKDNSHYNNLPTGLEPHVPQVHTIRHFMCWPHYFYAYRFFCTRCFFFASWLIHWNMDNSSPGKTYLPADSRSFRGLPQRRRPLPPMTPRLEPPSCWKYHTIPSAKYSDWNTTYWHETLWGWTVLQ